MFRESRDLVRTFPTQRKCSPTAQSQPLWTKRPCSAALTRSKSCWAATSVIAETETPQEPLGKGRKGPLGFLAPPSHLQMKELWV